MSVSDHDLEMLETWLDGELTEEQADALRRRMSNDTALAQMADQLRSDRQLRAHAWQGLDSDADVEKLVANVRRENRKHELWGSRLQTLRQVSGIAASVALMFGAGWISRSRLSTSPDSPTAFVATNTNPAPTNVQAAMDNSRGTATGTLAIATNELRMNRSAEPGAQFVSRQTPLNPLLVPFDTRSLSTTTPRFRVLVLDAFDKVQFEKPMDTFDVNDAIKFADYIAHYQTPIGSPAPAPNPTIFPVNESQSPR